MKALIINVGNEVLSGKVINTNSSYLAKELRKIGVLVEKVVVVGDDEPTLHKEFTDFKNSDYDILITTGGLGPTHDDLTKESLAKNLGIELELYQPAKDLLDSYFDNTMPECNLKQAYFPKGSIIIENKIGTADGAILSLNNKIYIILVGPPFELEPMVQDSVLPYLKKFVKEEKLSQDYIIMGMGESAIEEKLRNLFQKYPQVSICPYASLGKIRYEIIASIVDKKDFQNATIEFEELMKDYIISKKNEEIEQVLVNILKEKRYTISFAESVTGGMLASKIINVEGASTVMKESYITYSNEAKNKILGVHLETIDKNNVVSPEVVEAMVKGLYQLTKANVCVSVSGIAGPTGGSIDKPVGLIHYAIKINDQIYLENKIFKGNRDMVRTRATLWILYRIFSLLNS